MAYPRSLRPNVGAVAAGEAAGKVGRDQVSEKNKQYLVYNFFYKKKIKN